MIWQDHDLCYTRKDHWQKQNRETTLQFYSPFHSPLSWSYLHLFLFLLRLLLFLFLTSCVECQHTLTWNAPLSLSVGFTFQTSIYTFWTKTTQLLSWLWWACAHLWNSFTLASQIVDQNVNLLSMNCSVYMHVLY